MKVVVVVLSDPKANAEEALGRAFNALATAYELKQTGDEVGILFQGAGTRWVDVLSKPDHPVHGLFELVRDKVLGVSSGCADFFGAKEGAQNCNVPILSGNDVPGTSGLPRLRSWIADGYQVLTF